MHTVCGLLVHSSLAATTDGLPLGMAAARFWTRKKFKGTNALRRKVNPTRVPIEGKESMRWLDNLRQSTELLGDPARCVHICDREGDIWELFCLARELDTHFLVRRCSDRLAEDGSRTVASIMAEEKVRGLHWVAVRDDKGKLGSTQVEISYRRITVRPPIAKQKRYPALMLTVMASGRTSSPARRHDGVALLACRRTAYPPAMQMPHRQIGSKQSGLSRDGAPPRECPGGGQA